MNQELKQAKQTIRAFMRANYSDERLAMLLAHAQDGLLSYTSCCCFIGIPTADHALRGANGVFDEDHYHQAERLPDARQAETAYLKLWRHSCPDFTFDSDDIRRRRLIPIIKAEIHRRASRDAPKRLAHGNESLATAVESL